MDETHYQKLNLRPSATVQREQQPEQKYWRRFSAPTTTQQIGIVSNISFSTVQPHDYAVTSSTRVLVYDGITHALKKTISRFSDTAYGATYRSDGQLIVAGCESGQVTVFNTSTRTILRQFNQHKRPTHVSFFSPNKTHVVSGSDDTTIRTWDLADGKQLQSFQGHTDYVRTAATSSEATIVSGSYDHTVKLWDTRANGPQLTMQHGDMVESVSVFPSGRMLASAGGTCVHLWDLAGTGKPLASIRNHQKTVTCTHVVEVKDAAGVHCSRLVTGSLDGHVKLYDLETFRTTYAYKYPVGVTSVAVAPNLSCMVVGMADRSMVVRKHKKGQGAITAIRHGEYKAPKKERRYAPKLTAESSKYFTRGQNSKPEATDTVVHERRRVNLRPYDKLLKQFKYADAIDAALAAGRIQVAVSMIDELTSRGGLESTLSSRPIGSWLPLLRLMVKYVAHPDYTHTAMGIINLLLDLHMSSIPDELEALRILKDLRGRVITEIAVQSDLCSLNGVMEMLLRS